MEVFAKAMQQSSALRHVNEDFDEARNEILKGTGDAQRLSVNDLPIESETARAIATAKRTPSSEVQLNGTYVIKGVDLRQEGEVRLRVENQADGREFVATFQDNSLDSSQISLLQNAEWSRTKVYLSINARILRGEVTAATVVSVKEQPAKA